MSTVAERVAAGAAEAPPPCEAMIFKTGAYCGEDARHYIWHKITRPSEWYLCCRHFDSHYQLASHQHHEPAS